MTFSEEAVFAEALKIADPQERTKFLDRACAGNAALRAGVESLLAAYPAGSFLEFPAVQLPMGEQVDQAPSTTTEELPASRDDETTSLEFLPPSEKPGSLGRLAHYEILEVIGQGGMGIVLRAFDEKLHRVVAIKVMAPGLAATSPPRKRFLREARAAAAVRHECVVDIHAVEEQPIPYLVMEYVSGETLQQKLDRVGPLEVPEVLRLGQQITRGLAAAHECGLIHRDIKPSNILLENGAEERVKISDFGLARAAADASLTQSGVIAGTPMYMAPEQIQGEVIDHRADLFSLGSVLYTMCSGRPPFRATTTMATLKRVAEDTPRPIREIISEVPQWLCDVITKLHAKKPDERFQSAKEVADVLGQHLAHIEHPSLAPMPVGVASASGGCEPPVRVHQTGGSHPPLAKRGRWAVAAAVLLCLFGGLSLTEATGVTNLRATVIRIFTPDGTLVVETNDPGVKVTIEGDGGLVINGAGPQEVRLRPGSYKLHADRDGKKVPLERELVSIANGGREVVKVKVEGPPVQAAAKGEQAAPKSQPKPFVLLDVESSSELKFATLAEAVQNAYDGDVIEIRGDGPFVLEPIAINRALTIRAGDGFQPVFRVSPSEDKIPILSAYSPLVLEGLDFQLAGEKVNGVLAWYHMAINSAGRSLHIAHCRFESQPGANHACFGTNPTTCVIRDSLFLNAGHVAMEVGTTCKSLSIENNVFLGNIITRLGLDVPLTEETAVKLTGNTLLAPSPGHPLVYVSNSFSPKKWKSGEFKAVPVRAQGNLIDTPIMFHFELSEDDWKEIAFTEGEAFLVRVFSWQDRDNIYSAGRDRTFWYMNPPKESPTGLRSLADWKQLWNDPDTKCEEGHIRFRGGDLGARLAKAPDQITLDDFRLRADSAGYHAGKDGQDLGADVDRVGPGKAYDDWKKTPEYAQWQKQSGQKTKASPPESKAFALIGGAGVPEVRFDTLSEAVLASSDGDTIEVRGNGPFVSDAVTVSHKLTIRAGQGVRPVIRFERRAPAVPGYCLLHNTAHLTLEGLEFRIRSRTDGSLVNAGRTLDVANCRFYVPGLNICIWSGADTRYCRLRNSEFVAFMALEGGQTSDGEWVIENCIYAAGAVAVYDPAGGPPSGAVRISHVSLVSSDVNSAIGLFPASLKPPEKKADFRISESVLGSGVMLSVRRTAPALQEDGKPFTPESLAGLLPKLLTFAGTRNVYAPPDQTEFEYVMSWGDSGIWRHDLKTLEAWKNLWNSPETDCLEARVKFANGDLAAKIARDPESVTPDDYRLRPDSPGYQAGKDKKDLGADVDLVGPGLAYERWKKTPEYQQWLKDIGQTPNRAPIESNPKATDD